MKKYYVTCEETCPECKGKGEVENPDYAEYAAFETKTLEDLGLEKHEWQNPKVLEIVIPWLEERGYYDYPNELPWDVGRCDECDGSGIYRHTVDLKEAIADLG